MLKKTYLSLALNCALSAYAMFITHHLFNNIDIYQWDFRTYRISGELFLSGSDPYDNDILSYKTGRKLVYPYPPLTLYIFGLFSLLDQESASIIFLALKICILVFLIVLWEKHFLEKNLANLFYLFALLAFNSAIFIDIRSGNVNLVEQGLLWAGFYYFTKGKCGLFSIFVISAAIFKLIPIFFLFLLFFSAEKYRIAYFICSVSVFAIYLFSQYIWYPEYFMGFIQNVFIVTKESRILAPSTYKVVNDIVVSLNKSGFISYPLFTKIVTVSMISSAVAVITIVTQQKLQGTDSGNSQKITIFLFCLMYALIMPRFKDYSYIILIVPAFYLIQKVRSDVTWVLVFIFSILSGKYPSLPGVSSLFKLFSECYSLMIAYGIWGLYIYENLNYQKWYKHSR